MCPDLMEKNSVINSKPFLTIGIANYNYGKYLRRGFEAISRQAFRDIELIYADNNSTDDSQNIIREFMREADIPVSLITGSNIGICGNRNRILDHAHGQYLMICDSDDWMTDDCLEILCAKAIETNADQIIGAYQKRSTNGKISYRHFFPNGVVKWSNWGYHGSLYKIQIIKEHNIRFDLAWRSDDLCFNTLFHRYSGKTIFINNIVENWYMHNDSVTSMYAKEIKENTNTDRFEKTIPFMYKNWKELPNSDQEQLEYMWSMIYYLDILYRRPSKDFKNDLKDYHKLHEIMCTYFPNYLHNSAVKKLFGKEYCRKQVSAIIFFMALLERIHLIRQGLWVYWIFTHFYRVTNW